LEVDAKKIVLLRLSGVRRPVPSGTVVRQWSFWMKLPPRDGHYFATVSATDGTITFAETQTEPFDVRAA